VERLVLNAVIGRQKDTNSNSWEAAEVCIDNG